MSKKKPQQGPCPTCGQLVIQPPHPVPCDYEMKLVQGGLGFERPCPNAAGWSVVSDYDRATSAVVGNYCGMHVGPVLLESLREGQHLLCHAINQVGQ